VTLNPADTFVALLQRRAADCPDRVGYTFLIDGETIESSMTYGELHRHARAVAASIPPREDEPRRALLLYPPGLDYIVGLFGCLYAGAVAVPVYPPHPARLTRALPRLRAVARDVQPTTVLTTTALIGLRAALADDLPTTGWIATDATPAALADQWRDPGVDGRSLAVIQYTSGSTGSPRGVMLDHRHLMENSAVIQDAAGHTPASVGVIWLPPYHDMGLVGGILQPLYAGFPVVLLSPLHFLQQPLRWLKAISHHRGTIGAGPNFAYELCVRKTTPAQREALDLRSWEVAFVGAEPIRADTLEDFARAFAPCGFRREALYPCYGLAEATLMVTGGDKHGVVSLPSVVEMPSPGASDAPRLVACGRARGSHRIEIADPVTRVPLADGETGEIWVSGPSVARGYWRQPEATAAAFEACTIMGEGPFLRTGDLGFLKDGNLFVNGRLKDVIVIRGRNHYPHDIERDIDRCHPCLEPGGSAVFGVPLEGHEALVVVQEVPGRCRDPHWPAVEEAMRQTVLRSHGIAVTAIIPVAPATIPKTTSGKIQRDACRQKYLEGTLSPLFPRVLFRDAERRHVPSSPPG